MSEYLVIVESPAKASTIKKILGSKYKVEASMGHIRDLPKSKLGIDIDNNFEPEYINIRGKAELIKKLKGKYPPIWFPTKFPSTERYAIWSTAPKCRIKRFLVCFEFNDFSKPRGKVNSFIYSSFFRAFSL